MARKRFTGSPINAKQQELSQQAEALEREMARYERLIAEAPKRRKQEQERRLREREEQEEQRQRQFVLRTTAPRSPFDASDVLQDIRDGEEPGAGRPAKPRRAERRAARIQLAVMLVAVMAAGAFVLFLLVQLIQHLG